MVIGAQLYSVRDYTQTIKSFDETLSKVSKMGYTCIQVSAVGNIGVDNIRERAEKYGLKIIVTHYNQDRIKDDTDYVINEHKALGCDYIGIGSMPNCYARTKDGIEKFISDYKEPAKKISAAGLHLLYHNHNFEFEKVDGKLLLDYLVDGFTTDELGILLDLFWVQAGGGDPCCWMKKLKDRLDIVHYKDFTIVAGEKRFAPIMEGNMNFKSIFETSEEVGVKWAFVEQDDCYGKSPFECLNVSYNNLKQVGYK